MRIAESELIINPDGSVFHLHLRPEELADNVILVGDPGRVDMIAEYLSDKEFRHCSREFVSVTGRYNGERITVLSTGIGCDNIDIVMNELDALANIDFVTREPKLEKRSLNILRIGTSGALQPEIPRWPTTSRPSTSRFTGRSISQTLTSWRPARKCAGVSATAPFRE